YEVVDSRTGQVIYVGISQEGRAFRARQRAHERRFGTGVTIVPVATGLSRLAARTVEEALIRHYGFQNPAKNPGGCAGTLENKIHSISPRTPGYGSLVLWGRAELLLAGRPEALTDLRC